MAVICFLLLLLIFNVDGTCFNPDKKQDKCTWCWSYFENSRGPHTVEDIKYGGCDGKQSGYSPCTKELGFNLPYVHEDKTQEAVSYLECIRTTSLPAYHDRFDDKVINWNGKVCCCGKDMCNKDVERLDKYPLPIQCQNWPDFAYDQGKYSDCESDTCFGYFVKQENKWDVYRSGCSLGKGDLEGVCRMENIKDGHCTILDDSTYKRYITIDEKVENKPMKVCCCKGDKCNDDQLIE